MEIPVYDIKGIPIQVPPDRVKLKQIYEQHYRNTETPIVIDNGSFTCRAGWGGMEEPILNFRNIVARQKNQKDMQEVLVGSEIPDSDVFKLNIKSPFERDVIQHIHTQEFIFDYMFEHLGIQESSISHPVLITETICSPNYSRNMLFELLFECYGVPSVNLGIDGIFAFQNEIGIDQSGLIVKLGHQTSHILPYYKGEFLPLYSRRINIGGLTCTQFLLKYLQARYFFNRNSITQSLAQEIIYSYCYTALDYRIELEKLRSYNQIKIQLPWVMTQQPTQEELNKRREKRKEQGKRLREISVKKSEEKRKAAAIELEELEALSKLYRKTPTKFQEGLISRGLANYEELKRKIKMLKTRLNIEVDDSERFNLIDIPDEELSAQLLKQKQMQIIQKKSHEARKIRKQKQMEEKEMAEKQLSEDPNAYLQDLYKQREEIVERMEERNKIKKELNNRHSRTSQRRLRDIADLSTEKKDDSFGMNDQDWDIYRDIQKDTLEDEEEDQVLLNEIDDKIAKLDSSHLINIGAVVRPPCAEDYQILIDVDRVRPPEMFFQPSLIGLEQAGLPLVIEQVLALFPSHVSQELAQCTYLYGGPCFFPGLVDRVNSELRMIRPFESDFNVRICNELNQAWKGASQFSLNPQFLQTAWTREEYLEQGPLRNTHVHSASNLYHETPQRTEKPHKKSRHR